MNRTLLPVLMLLVNYLGQLKSMATTAIVLGSAFGPLPFGVAYGQFGSYSRILWVL